MSATREATYKQLFIDESYPNANSKKTMMYHLAKFEAYEQQLGKALYAMDEAELLAGLKRACKALSPNTVIAVISTVSSYIDWAIAKGLAVQKNPLHRLNKSGFAKDMLEAPKRVIYTRQQLYTYMEQLLNDTDRALLLALFEGLKGKEFSEIFSLTIDDLERLTIADTTMYIAHVKNNVNEDVLTRQVIISEKLYDLLHRANDQEKFRTEDGKKETPFNMESPYIFKRGKKGKQQHYLNMLDRHSITRRFLKFKELFGNSALEADDIRFSGMMDLAYQLIVQHGEVTNAHYELLYKQFDTRLASSNGVYYVNTTYLRTEVYNEQFDDVYGDLIRQQQHVPKKPFVMPLPYREATPKVETETEAGAFVTHETVARHSRLDSVKLAALARANYECAVNRDHRDFISKATGKNYVEVHHLIPLKYQHMYAMNLDDVANIVCLCAGCHRQLHYGELRGKQEMLLQLYNERKDALASIGIALTRAELVALYEADFDEELAFVNE